MNNHHIDKTKTAINNFEKLPEEDRKVMCERLESIKKDIEPLLKKVKELPENDEDITICHGDLHFENFLLQNNDKVYLIDFDVTGMNYYYYDLALFLEHVSGKDEFTKLKKDGFEECIDQVLKKYMEIRPLSISFEELKKRVRLFRPIMKIFWLHIFTMFPLPYDFLTMLFYLFKDTLLPHYREVVDKVLLD
jgi:thiamine kinase-like enzyme